MNVNPDDIVHVDYSKMDPAAQALKPTVYRDGSSFCCLYGSDPVEGIFGCGSTPEEAVADWRIGLQNRLDESPRNDNVSEFVREKLGIGNRPIDPDVQAFYDQFKPRKAKDK
jgi:hypothetical protein